MENQDQKKLSEKKSYTKPKVTRVKLTATEVVLGCPTLVTPPVCEPVPWSI